MKKKIYTIIAISFIFSVTSLFAQESKQSTSAKEIFTSFGGTVESKNIIVNGGVGVDFSVFDKIGYYIPLVGISGEYTLQCGPCPLGFGLFVNYTGNNNYSYYTDKNGSSGNRITTYNNNIVTGLLVNYHINLPVEKLDVYIGPRVGATINILSKSDYHKNTLTGQWITDKSLSVEPSLYIGGAVGATCYFTNSIGANVELGYPTLAKVNFNFKF